MSDFLSALTALSTAVELGKTLVDTRDTAKAQDSLIQFQRAIIDANKEVIAAQAAHTALATEVNKLKEECVRLQNWDAEKQQYTLTEIGHGVFACVRNDHAGELAHAHKLCCSCFEQGRKSLLQQYRIDVGRMVGLKCHNKCPDLTFQQYKERL